MVRNHMASQFFTLYKKPSNKLDPKNPTGMHWYCCNDAVQLLNEAKYQYVDP